MKIQGHQVSEIFTERVVFERPVRPIVFTVAAVLDFSEFDRLVPRPTPRERVYPDGRRELVKDDEDYNAAIRRYSELRWYYIVLKSMSATEGLEWEKVVFTQPETWHRIDEELKDAKLCDNEIAYLVEAIQKVNALDPEKIAAAKKLFTPAPQ